MGSLLFITFMTDSPLHFVSPLDMHTNYSTFSVTRETIEKQEIKLNADFTNVHQWCQINKMTVNANKTKVMLVTTYQREANYHHQLSMFSLMIPY